MGKKIEVALRHHEFALEAEARARFAGEIRALSAGQGYASWVGRIGELYMAKSFIRPVPPRVVLIDASLIAKNLPREAWDNVADVVLYNQATNCIEGLMEVKTTSRTTSTFRIMVRADGCSWFRAAKFAEVNGVPVWLGVLRLKEPLPYRRTPAGGRDPGSAISPDDFLKTGALSNYIREAVVYDRNGFGMDEHAIRIKHDARPIYRLEGEKSPPSQGGLSWEGGR